MSQNLAAGWWGGLRVIKFPSSDKKRSHFSKPCVFGHCHLQGAEDVKAILDGFGHLCKKRTTYDEKVPKST